MKYELKTQCNDADVYAFLDSVEDQKKKEDAYRVLEIMKDITGEVPKMWGDAMVGFGKYHYKTKSGCEADYMRVAFSPRKTSLAFYIMPGYHDFFGLLEKLGKHRAGKACLHIKRLSDIDIDVLKEIIKKGWDKMEELYPRK